MKPLERAHLPQGPVGLCAVGARYEYIVEALRRRGIACIAVADHPALPEAVAGHADLLMHPLGGKDVAAAPGQPDLELELAAWELNVLRGRSSLENRYPGDVALNCFVLGGALFCREGAADPMLSERYARRGVRIRPVRQGYAKCSVCIVDERSAFTADTGLHRAMTDLGLDSLLIRPGHIVLPGYDTGFIGGCAGLLDRGLLAFAGDVGSHPDWADIRCFCRARGVETDCLSTGPLEDIGGMIPLMEA